MQTSLKKKLYWSSLCCDYFQSLSANLTLLLNPLPQTPQRLARETCTRDLPERLARETCTRDLHERLAWETCTRDLHERLARETCTRDLHERLAQETCPRDLHERLSEALLHFQAQEEQAGSYCLLTAFEMLVHHAKSEHSSVWNYWNFASCLPVL